MKAIAVSFLLCLSVSFGQDRQPNVVVILTDDQGWGDLSLHGNTNLSTPNIDAMAKGGAQFDRFYVCPVCSPTRAEFLTGRYHPRSRVYSTSAGGERMDLDETTIADVFKAAGYATAAFGKWHTGMQYPYHPNGRGFDEFYGFCSGHWGDYFSPPLDHNGKIVRGEGFVIDDFTDKAMDFMEANQEKPFLVYLPYNTPHSPMQVPDRWWDKFKNKELAKRHFNSKNEKLGHTRAALAMCENIDWNVGRVLEKLDSLKLSEDTIVVYFCDNGPNGVRWNGRMKGRKGSTDEGGVRSPLFIRWPGKIMEGYVHKEPTSAIDLLPTLAGLAGVDAKTANTLDGLSVRNFLLGEPVFAWVKDRPIYSHWNNRVAVRKGDYLLDHQGQLFDLVKDPEQRMNVAAGFPDIAQTLTGLANDWKKGVLAGYRDDDRAFLVGHPDYRYTQIPARDGKAHGGIKRSNRFPNCSYFTNWKTTDDKVTWEVEVTHSANYQVEVHYSCPQESVGSTLSLTFGDSALTGRISEAHDPPVRGGENDRVTRAESYVKAFGVVNMGSIPLMKGSGTLTLQANDVVGEEVMDFRLLMLTRQD